MKCPRCGEDVEELVSVQVDGKRTRACEDCASSLDDEAEIAAEATTAMKGMMEYKGGRR
jgi:ribosome-binding protein aMBF1 (putative translation factor)